ncbi:hypothetical protein [Agromyces laixinhei]|uniref:hypothetical protein n=1 Tax=Agromyces laixinhei TaxID=2585717 RepID=UPI0012EEBED5|nr:hypothetical protein [Agromyces laixinhei]
MADFMRYLPLGQRDRGPELDVSSDWRDEVADVIDRTAVALDAAELDDAAGTRIADRFLSGTGTRRHPVPEHADPPAAAASASPDAPASPSDRLRAYAVAIRLGRPAPVSLLARAVAAYLLLAREVDAAPALPDRTSGAVALYLAAKAPAPIRAVISGHALRALDAEWDFGRGPVLEQQAIPMLEFLLGRGIEAPVAHHPR